MCHRFLVYFEFRVLKVFHLRKCFFADTHFLELLVLFLLLLLLLLLLSLLLSLLLLLLYCHSEKKVAVISKHCCYHDCTVSNDSSNHSLKSLHLLYCHYYSVLPSNSLCRDLFIL